MMITKRIEMMVGCLVLALSLFSGHVNAALLGVVQTYPDIAANPLTTTFTDATDTLSIVGSTTVLTESDGATMHTFATNHTLTAVIDDSGNFVSGTLNFDTNGILALLNDSSVFPSALDIPSDVSVLEIALSAFGVEGTFGLTVMDFVGTVTSVHPTVASFFPVGTPIGVIYDPGSNATFSGAWDEDWRSEVGSTNTFAIPEPTSAMLALGAGALLVSRRCDGRTA